MVPTYGAPQQVVAPSGAKDAPKEVQAQLDLIQPHWRDVFVQFVRSGEAPQEFLDYLDQDEHAQKAVEMAFRAQAHAFERLAKELAKEVSSRKGSAAAGVKIAPPGERAAVLANRLVVDLEGSVDLTNEDQRRAVMKIASGLRTKARKDSVLRFMTLVAEGLAGGRTKQRTR